MRCCTLHCPEAVQLAGRAAAESADGRDASSCALCPTLSMPKWPLVALFFCVLFICGRRVATRGGVRCCLQHVGRQGLCACSNARRCTRRSNRPLQRAPACTRRPPACPWCGEHSGPRLGRLQGLGPRAERAPISPATRPPAACRPRRPPAHLILNLLDLLKHAHGACCCERARGASPVRRAGLERAAAAAAASPGGAAAWCLACVLGAWELRLSAWPAGGAREKACRRQGAPCFAWELAARSGR